VPAFNTKSREGGDSRQKKEPALELYIIINNAASEISVFHTNVLFECVCVRVCACVCGYAPLPVTCRVDEQT
jgi:hypothetical protein